MNIALVTYDYPDGHRSVFPFVKALVDEWSLMGHCVTVIAPFSISRAKSLSRFQEIEHLDNVHIIRPKIITFSSKLKLGKMSMSDLAHKWAVNKSLNQLAVKPDVIYCHFWKEAIFAYDYSTSNNVPIVVASGESEIPSFLSEDPFLSKCQSVSKVICVSSKNKNESISMGLTTIDKCIVLPNAIDSSLFQASPQPILKSNLGITDNDFVVAFVGWFNERKGSKRVSAALEKLCIPSIKSIFIGSGSEEPVCNGIVFKGVLPHEKIPLYLNCADLFVLPTLHEGCCNAIVEALACGLPVVSSDREFNWDILNSSNSILVEPTDVSSIASAIKVVYDDKERRLHMRDAALNMAENLTINNRAKRIIDFIKD